MQCLVCLILLLLIVHDGALHVPVYHWPLANDFVVPIHSGQYLHCQHLQALFVDPFLHALQRQSHHHFRSLSSHPINCQTFGRIVPTIIYLAAHDSIRHTHIVHDQTR